MTRVQSLGSKIIYKFNNLMTELLSNLSEEMSGSVGWLYVNGYCIIWRTLLIMCLFILQREHKWSKFIRSKN